MPRANYVVIKDTPERIEIADVGPWDRFMSVTNAAESVIEELHPKSGQRVFYFDSEGEYDEIVHVAGRFTGFRPARKTGV